MKPLPVQLTVEDEYIWGWVCFAFEPALTGVEGVEPLMRSVDQDRRDAAEMLIMVDLQASKVAQTDSGHWCWFGHAAWLRGER